MNQKKVEASQAFLDSISDRSQMGKDLRQGNSIEGLIKRQNRDNLLKEDTDPNDRITLQRVMELDGITGATELRVVRNSEHKTHLFAADASGYIKRRLLDNYSRLQTAFDVEEGIIASSVGTIHRPSLAQLCGDREVRIQQPATNKAGAIGQWKPINFTGGESFKHGIFEEIMTIVPEYMETPMGSVYKYAFAIRLSDRNTLSGITVDVAALTIDSILLLLEGEMLNDFYGRLISKAGVQGVTVGTEALGSQDRDGSKYNIDENAWRGLHRSFGKNHGLTDIFCDGTQEQVIHGLPIGSSASISVGPSDSLTELRNRLADGTYVWSHFLDEPREYMLPAIDRASCAALYYVDNSEIRERKIDILTGETIITFSVIMGFDVIDPYGLKVVSITGAS